MRTEKVLAVHLSAPDSQLAGRALGERLFAERIAPVLGKRGAQDIVLVSLQGAVFATGSFFKAIWLPMHPQGEPAIPSALADLSEDVRFEFDTFLKGHRLPGLEAMNFSPSRILIARVHGQVEEPAKEALRALQARPGSTAPELFTAAGGIPSATAWTNRLNELHRHGLVLRERAGRAWRFFPLAVEVNHG